MTKTLVGATPSAYLSGPMRGYEEFNYPAFHNAAEKLRKGGWEIFNPAEQHNGDTGLTFIEYMNTDIPLVMKADAIILLPGWRDSSGAAIEYIVACALGKETYEYVEDHTHINGFWLNYVAPETFEGFRPFALATTAVDPLFNNATHERTDESVLQEAQRLVHGDRGADYGHPVHDFTRTGRIWAAVLGLPEVTPQQVALCMIGVKMSREVNRPKRDNRVDIAGYVETLDMVETYTEPPSDETGEYQTGTSER